MHVIWCFTESAHCLTFYKFHNILQGVHSVITANEYMIIRYIKFDRERKIHLYEDIFDHHSYVHNLNSCEIVTVSYHCYLHPKMQTYFSCQFQILWPLPDENKAHMIQMVAKRSMHRTSNKVYYTQVYEWWLGQLQWSAYCKVCTGILVKSHLENGRGHKSTKQHFKLLFLVR